MEPTIKLELTLSEVNMILAGLGELPFKTSADVIQKIRMSALPQIAPKTDDQKEE